MMKSKNYIFRPQFTKLLAIEVEGEVNS